MRIYFWVVVAILLAVSPSFGQILYRSPKVSISAEPTEVSRPGEVIPGTEGVVLEPGVNLDGFDLRAADLKDVPSARLRGANLSQAFLANMPSANFAGANLNNSWLSGQMSESNYSNASLEGAAIRGDQTGSNFTMANLNGAFVYPNDLFASARFDGATLERTRLSGDFFHASFDGASFGFVAESRQTLAQSLNGDFLGASFVGATFDHTILNGSFIRADFRESQLTNTQLVGGFQHATFEGVDLTNNVDFGRPSLRTLDPFLGTDFSHTDLSGIQFSEGMEFTNASFRGADLSDVVFRRATLFGVDLRQANLSNVIFRKGADLTLSDVRQVDFSNTTGGMSLRGAKYDQFTVFQTDRNDPAADGMEYVPAIPGDTNLDDRVTFEDFLLLSADFGATCEDAALACWQRGDFDLNGKVGFSDFLLQANSFSTLQVNSVPEPMANIFVIQLLLGCLGLRKRNHRLPKTR